ncbi:MAG: CsbD family protein [Proteobacteria bacterium]|nr:MAG: CsbD family protein [Pseudomonadota bacterium]
MDKKWTGDTAKQVRGSVLEAIGRLTGDTAVEAQGAAEKSAAEAKKPAGDTPGKGAKPR